MPVSPSDTFKQMLRDVQYRIGLLAVSGIAITCGILQLAFTHYFEEVSTILLAVTAAIAVVSGATAFYARKHPNFQLKIAQYLLLHVIALLAYCYLLPIPSVYLIFITVLAMIVYFEFGSRAMWISFGVLFMAVSGRYLQLHGLHHSTGWSVLLVFFAAIMAVTYFAVQFLKIAQEQMAEITSSSSQALTNQRETESLINNISDGVMAVDQDLKILSYNAVALNVLDINTDIKGEQLAQYLKPIDANNQPVDILDLLRGTKVATVNRELRLQYGDGSVANLFMGISPIYLGYGQAKNNGYTLLLRDITREKSLEEERNEFISVVSHELRTPIAITEGNISNAQFIASKTGDIKQIQAALDASHQQIQFLAELVNDLSTLSRAERGALQVEITEIDVQKLAEDLVSTYREEAKEKGLEIIADIAPGLGTLFSSQLYVKEVVQNFVTNAIKYTEKGSITIGVKPEKKGVTFAVHDTGIGISKSDQEKIFDKFFRSEDFRTRQNNGTGLGLYVTMKLVKLIHAELSVESELNRGSTFIIFVPNLK